MGKFFLYLRDEDGQGLVEYALIVGFIALVAIGAIAIFGNTVNNLFKNPKLNNAIS